MRLLSIASLGVAAALALGACGGAATPAPTSAPATIAPAASVPPAATPAGSAAAGSPAASAGAVSIANFAFSPASITVAVGKSVTWTNNDSATHTVTWDDGSAGSDRLAPGASYSRTFTTAGTFTYHCSIHTSMKGTVVVGP